MLRYVTHPEVQIDPRTPVPRWRLSERGRRRLEALLDRPWMRRVRRVVCSDEVKARQAGETICRALGLSLEVRAGIHENDRSATGFVPPEAFEGLVAEFFAQPARSVRGWERAVDAQARIARGLADLLPPQARDESAGRGRAASGGTASGGATSGGTASGGTAPVRAPVGGASGDDARAGAEPAGDVVVVGHGGVGTLWYCHLAGLPIARAFDQPHQGCHFSVGARGPLHPWLPFEQDPPAPRVHGTR